MEKVLESIGVNVVGRSVEADSALALLDEQAPELLITELQGANGSMGGLDLIQEARRRQPSLRVVVLAGSQDPADIDKAFEAGAVAYVMKTAQPGDIAAAIRQTFDRSLFLPDSTRWPSPSDNQTGRGRRQRRRSDAQRARDPRARVEGHSNQAVGKMLWVTERR